MRLKTVAKLCRSLAPKFRIVSTQAQGGGWAISNHSEISRMIGELHSAGFMNETIDPIIIEHNAILTQATTIAVIDAQGLQAFSSSLRLLQAALNAVADAIEISVRPDSDLSVSIKLPHVQYFDDLTEVTRDINITLANLLAEPEIDQKIEVLAFDNGSLWIEIAASGVVGLNIIGALTWSAYAIMNKRLEFLHSLESLRAVNIANDHIEGLRKNIEEHMQKLLEAEALALVKAKSLPERVELITKIGHSIERLSKLLESGMELHPSQTASVESKQEFPKVGLGQLIELKQKLLSTGI